MKRIIAMVGCAFLLASCSSNPKYTISGSVNESDLNNSYVYLFDLNNTAAAIDSALVVDGAFTLKGEYDMPVMAQLRFADDKVKLQRTQPGQNSPFAPIFVLEKGMITADLTNTPRVTGTAENDAWAKIQAQTAEYRAQIDALMSDLQSDDLTISQAAEAKYNEIDANLKVLFREYIIANNDKLSGGRLMYDCRHTFNETERRELVAQASPLFKTAPGMTFIIDHLETLDRVAIGKAFTDFSMLDVDGETRKLSDFVGNGKVVLLDFWASWCPPCIRDMPHLVDLYARYKDKNFEIIGVSLDSKKEAWMKGIQDHGITWPQLSDLKYWENAGAKLYGVNSIPHTVLIDSNGIIVGKYLRGEELELKITELIPSK